MPSFADFLEEQQRWELVWYVMSLRTDWDLNTARDSLGAGPEVVVVKPVEEEEEEAK